VGPQYATRCRIQHRENATRRRTTQRLAAIGTRAPAILLALAGQIAPEGQARAAVQQRDSQHVLRSAREAQAEFESVRRHNLPTQFGAGGTDCDERIGRFCFWYDDGAASPGSPPPEPERIGRARDRLVARLDTAAAAVPGDDWIAGQRVRYLLQSGRSADALAAAQACRAAPWWCEALAGLAQHVAGNYAGADSAFRTALRDMPRDERCRWTDVSLLLDGELARRYRRLPCDERGAFEERLWWLAQPLYSLPGNDRRTEHLARATMARIEQDARSPFAMSWGDDMRETLLRYGWPAYWTQQPSRSIGLTEPLVTSHEPEPAFHFLPDAGAFDDPGSSHAEHWTPAAPRPRERYAPAYATAFAPLEHQVALFRRGDSCLVVAAYDVSDDTLFGEGAARDVALVLARDERSAPVIERRPAASSRDVIVAKVGAGPQLMSLELVAAARRHVARARYGVRPHDTRDGLSLSDILLFNPPDSLPTELAAVLPYVRGSTVVRGSARVGLFWEIAGLDSAEATTTVVTVLPVGSGWLRRAAESLHIAGHRASVRLEWQELPQLRGAVASRPLAVDLSGLSPGRYRIEIAVHGASGRRAVAMRDIEVAGR